MITADLIQLSKYGLSYLHFIEKCNKRIDQAKKDLRAWDNCKTEWQVPRLYYTRQMLEEPLKRYVELRQWCIERYMVVMYKTLQRSMKETQKPNVVHIAERHYQLTSVN